MIALLLAAALAQQPPHIEERRQVAEELEKNPEPPLETRADVDAVNAALQTPERLWRFVTASETSWPDRMVAARRGTLPISFLPRFAAAERELAREDAEHHWGMDRFVPRYSSMAYSATPPFRGPHKRHVLGREWIMGDERIDEPLTYDEKAAAPWPWQVEQAIAVLRPKFFVAERAAEFWEVALSLPRNTVDEAMYFYRLTDTFGMMIRRIDPRVIQAWREIGLREGDFLAQRLPLSYAFDAIGLARSGDEWRYGEVMLADWADNWSSQQLVGLAFHLRDVGAPPVAVEVLARRIDSLGAEDVFLRGYTARYFLQAVDPKIVPNGPDPNDPELLERTWAVFRDWYGAHYDSIGDAAVAHQKILARYR